MSRNTLEVMIKVLSALASAIRKEYQFAKNIMTVRNRKFTIFGELRKYLDRRIYNNRQYRHVPSHLPVNIQVIYNTKKCSKQSGTVSSKYSFVRTTMV